MANVTKKKSTKKQPDAIALLKEDHKSVDALFKRFEKAKGAAAKQKLVATICQELKVHAQIEEEIFYPAVREEIEEQDLMDEAAVEHQGIKGLVAQLEGANPDEDMYDAKVTVLAEYVKHHVKEEQTEMFPKARKAKADIKALGDAIRTRKKELKAELK